MLSDRLKLSNTTGRMHVVCIVNSLELVLDVTIISFDFYNCASGLGKAANLFMNAGLELTWLRRSLLL